MHHPLANITSYMQSRVNRPDHPTNPPQFGELVDHADIAAQRVNIEWVPIDGVPEPCDITDPPELDITDMLETYIKEFGEGDATHSVEAPENSIGVADAEAFVTVSEPELVIVDGTGSIIEDARIVVRYGEYGVS